MTIGMFQNLPCRVVGVWRGFAVLRRIARPTVYLYIVLAGKREKRSRKKEKNVLNAASKFLLYFGPDTTVWNGLTGTSPTEYEARSMEHKITFLLEILVSDSSVGLFGSF